MTRTHSRALWIFLAVLFLGALLLPRWMAYHEFLTDPDLFAGDARQQIVPFLVSNPDQDFITRYYREVFTPVGTFRWYATLGHWIDPDTLARYTGLGLFLLTIGFIGAATRNLTNRWTALAAMVFAASATAIIELTIHGLPRGFSLPIMAASVWAASLCRWRAMAVITALSSMFYPVITVVSGFLFGALSIFQQKGKWNWRAELSHQHLMLLIGTAVAALVLFILPAHWNNDTYGSIITPSMLKDYPEAGPRGRYRSAHDSIWGQDWSASLQYNTYVSFAGSGRALVPPLNLRSYLSLGEMLPYILGLYIFIIGGLVLLYRQGNQKPLYLAATSAVIIGLAYTAAYQVMPYGFLPDRYMAYTLPVLVPILLACALEGFAVALARSWRPLLPLWRLAIFAIPLIAFGADGVQYKGHDQWLHGDIKRKHVSPEFEQALRQLPENAVLAGWPNDDLDSIAFFTRRHVWMHYETHQAFHTAYVKEMRRRMMLLINATFGPDPKTLERLRLEGVTHLLVNREFYKRETPPGYFSPFNGYMERHWSEWKHTKAAVLRVPDNTIVFKNDDFMLISLTPLSPIGSPPVGSHTSDPDTYILDASAFIHRMPKGDTLETDASTGLKGLFNNAAIRFNSKTDAIAKVKIAEQGNYSIFAYSAASSEKSRFTVGINDRKSRDTFGNGPLSFKRTAIYGLHSNQEIEVRIADIRDAPLLSAIVITKKPNFSLANLKAAQFPAEVKTLKEYHVPPGFSVRFGDLNGDGKMDLVSFAYDWSVRAIDNDGHTLWEYKAPESNGACIRTETEPPGAVWDFDGDGKAEVVQWRMADNRETLAIVDGTTGKVIRQTAWPARAWPHLYNNYRIAIAKLRPGDRAQNIITLTDSGGFIDVSAYQPDLNRLWNYQQPLAKDHLGHYIYPVDVDKDGIDEIQLSHVLLNNDGKEIWSNLKTPPFDDSHYHSDGFQFLDLNGDTKLETISAQSNLGLYAYDTLTGKVLWHRPALHTQSVEYADIFANTPSPQIAVHARQHAPKRNDDDTLVDQLFAQLYWFDPTGKQLMVWPQSPINGNPLFAKGDWRGKGKDELFWHRFHINSDGTGTLFFTEPVYQVFDFMGNGAEQAITLDWFTGVVKVYGFADAPDKPVKRDSEYIRKKITNHSGY